MTDQVLNIRTSVCFGATSLLATDWPVFVRLVLLLKHILHMRFERIFVHDLVVPGHRVGVGSIENCLHGAWVVRRSLLVAERNFRRGETTEQSVGQLPIRECSDLEFNCSGIGLLTRDSRRLPINLGLSSIFVISLAGFMVIDIVLLSLLDTIQLRLVLRIIPVESLGSIRVLIRSLLRLPILNSLPWLWKIIFGFRIFHHEWVDSVALRLYMLLLTMG